MGSRGGPEGDRRGGVAGPAPVATAQVAAFMAPLPMYPAEPARAIIDAVDHVAALGPSARRPVLGEVLLEPDHRGLVGLLGGRLREVRPPGTTVRILCVFDRDRRLVLLYAGDKAGGRGAWYRRAIPEAARLYREYLRESGQDGPLGHELDAGA